MSEAPRKNEVWVRDTSMPGKHRFENGAEIRVMTDGPVEGYVMCRRTGAAPFVVSCKELTSSFRRKEPKP